MPKSNLSYWKPKLEKNKYNDAQNKRILGEQGWRVLVIWECQLKKESCMRSLADLYDQIIHV